MDTFYTYHVVTERPMYVGQHISFDAEYPSGVYTRVMSKLEIVKDIYENPRNYEDKELEYPIKVALRELALEEVRKEEFPQYPSRMGCLYVSEHLQEAIQWADYFIGLGRPTFAIVKLCIRGRYFIGDASKCFDGTTNREENLRMARCYWENKTNPDGQPSIKEYLVDGDIEVVEIIKEYI